ncbi:hypothetical protein B0T10DRAFT_495710 [Thelonectria olida]|uniref:Uncharacterized protein n=1 Tax=Thelonectria olida TaxID=1576542 RepID=A0A9P9AHE1_9HYPO|nr:hypothetical protein B0T10DRAFT_495710 [Thelonectria olida]
MVSSVGMSLCMIFLAITTLSAIVLQLVFQSNDSLYIKSLHVDSRLERILTFLLCLLFSHQSLAIISAGIGLQKWPPTEMKRGDKRGCSLFACTLPPRGKRLSCPLGLQSPRANKTVIP